MRRVTIPMLRAHLETRAREIFWQTYAADRLWECVQCLTGGKGEIMAFSKIMSGIDAKKAPGPTESAEEIRKSILMKLRGESK